MLCRLSLRLSVYQHRKCQFGVRTVPRSKPHFPLHIFHSFSSPHHALPRGLRTTVGNYFASLLQTLSALILPLSSIPERFPDFNILKFPKAMLCDHTDLYIYDDVLDLCSECSFLLMSSAFIHGRRRCKVGS
jgi:hypothetical protein